jgi:osmotically-inducible protein OsmY
MWTRTMFYALALAAASTVSDDRAGDVWLKLKSRFALMLLKDSDTVHVDATEGVVTLYGRVASEASRAAAERRVRGLEGVANVENLLEVIPPSLAKATARRDDVIRRTAEATLENEAMLVSSNITILAVANGAVMLGGQAHDPGAEMRAIQVVEKIAGVRRVDARVALAPQ